MCQNNSAKICFEKILTGLCNPAYFRLCIDLMHITPPVTPEGLMAPITRGMPNALNLCRPTQVETVLLGNLLHSNRLSALTLSLLLTTQRAFVDSADQDQTE